MVLCADLTNKIPDEWGNINIGIVIELIILFAQFFIKFINSYQIIRIKDTYTVYSTLTTKDKLDIIMNIDQILIQLVLYGFYNYYLNILTNIANTKSINKYYSTYR